MMSYNTLNRKSYEELFDYTKVVDPVREQEKEKET